MLIFVYFVSFHQLEDILMPYPTTPRGVDRNEHRECTQVCRDIIMTISWLDISKRREHLHNLLAEESNDPGAPIGMREFASPIENHVPCKRSKD